MYEPACVWDITGPPLHQMYTKVDQRSTISKKAKYSPKTNRGQKNKKEKGNPERKVHINVDLLREWVRNNT